jgi:hypothetical protein
VEFDEILIRAEGPERTAALVSWIQGLFADGETAPILVGGAAVELYTRGAYTTGDVDLVGSVTAPVARALEKAGFRRHGRHWIHEPRQIFVEFPGTALGRNEKALWLEVTGQRVRIISAEDLLIDRLGGWEHWRSSVDGVNALLLWLAQSEHMDVDRVESRIEDSGWQKAWRSLIEFVSRWEREDPSPEEIEEWANRGP